MSAITPDMPGTFGDGVTISGVEAIASWAVGAASGATIAAFQYGETCWW